jgi:hypothetical protein
MSFDIEKMKSPEFSINNIKFKVIKLSAMEGFRLFEKIRHALASQAGMAQADNQDANAALFIKAVMTLPPETIEDFMNTLFKGLKFSGKGVEKGWANFSDLQDMALEGLQPLDIYELFIRCLIVNFIESFYAISSRFPSVKRLFGVSKQSTSPNS